MFLREKEQISMTLKDNLNGPEWFIWGVFADSATMIVLVCTVCKKR